MFFSGDPSTRKRVALGGRSNKENDRQKLLEKTRLERERRSWLRKQTSAATKIQKFYRGRKDVEAAHIQMREQFYRTYGKHCEKVESTSFCPDSAFLRQLLYFFNANNVGDFKILVEICRFLQQYLQEQGNFVSLFSGMDYFSRKALVDYRVKQLAYTCIQAVYKNRYKFKNQHNASFRECNQQMVLLLDTAASLIEPNLPWVCKTVEYLLQRNIFANFREIVLIVQESIKTASCSEFLYPLERLLGLMIPHTGQMPCSCPIADPQWSFSSQLLTIAFLWQLFPRLREVFVTQGYGKHYVNQMALCMKSYTGILPKDVSPELPGYACLLGNTLETAAVALAQADCSFEMASDLATILTRLLEALTCQKKFSQENKESSISDEDVIADGDFMSRVLNKDLLQQIIRTLTSGFLIQLINVLFGWILHARSLNHEQTDERLVIAVDAACAFLHVALETFPLDQILIVLAYRTELVPVLWNFIKLCHDKDKWPSLTEHSQYLVGEAPGWLLPLSVFCPVFKLMLMLTDNEEFYEQEKPLPLEDVRCLVVILRQALWQLLWVLPVLNQVKAAKNQSNNRNHLEMLQRKVIMEVSQLLSQLLDWNSRRQFILPSLFHADGINETFIAQAMLENTRAHDILKQAPFLIPFTSRVKIFASQLASHRQRQGSQSLFTRNRFRIRRDHILEDAYNQMNKCSEEDLRGLIRVTFINEFGVEEAGIDGGGIFKDFMENITRAAFDCQYGLFKETSDHLLYPNPGSGLIHEHHLQYFHFLGTLLGKAMYEGILVDIPFATFFLSKLKQKHNYLNDLPSLDPELYRHLIFLKNYKGNLSELELYFVIVNNEYGEQREEQLVPNGKDQHVTNENVIAFVRLVANHRLNLQIRQQSVHFLRGLHQLIWKEWIDMFNEHELQLLISGSLESLDVDDLRDNANYAGGYHKDHYVIEMFWEVLKGFSVENQKKFLKFVTGCSRGPLLGFRYLEPAFCIQRTAGTVSDEELNRLPTSATCMNLLKLPPYTSKEHLERKLFYAINADAGFDLS
ncbi:hypothetical protein SAY87_031001 [Trapa incisa]|uniref:HECT-type E3 ubiquitin transferase n=1 Tax=Trapa incisa TaxID=236973 RepID=A0AAN7KQC8_9MYRT|nr:hypothetical protein SAY87_031001 [Trapa incisa]